MKSFKQFFSENIAGIFKDASEWEKSAKARGLVVKSMTHPSGEMTKYQIAKDKEGNNRGHFDHGTKTGHLKEEVEQLDELSPKTLKSYSDKANKSLDRLAKQRDAIEKSMHKTYAAVDKRNAAEKAAHSATSQTQHNKATAAYRVADKSAKKNLAGHNDLAKQHSQLTKKINKRMDGMDRAYDKMHEEVELEESTNSKFKKGDKVHYETSRYSKDNKGVVHSHDGDQVTIIGKDWLGGPQKITVHQGFVRKQ